MKNEEAEKRIATTIDRVTDILLGLIYDIEQIESVDPYTFNDTKSSIYEFKAEQSASLDVMPSKSHNTQTRHLDENGRIWVLVDNRDQPKITSVIRSLIDAVRFATLQNNYSKAQLHIRLEGVLQELDEFEKYWAGEFTVPPLPTDKDNEDGQ